MRLKCTNHHNHFIAVPNCKIITKEITSVDKLQDSIKCISRIKCMCTHPRVEKYATIKNVKIIPVTRESIRIYKTSSSTKYFINPLNTSNRYSTKLQGISPKIHHTSNGESKHISRIELRLPNNKNGCFP